MLYFHINNPLIYHQFDYLILIIILSRFKADKHETLLKLNNKLFTFTSDKLFPIYYIFILSNLNSLRHFNDFNDVQKCANPSYVKDNSK